jgi:hypothetical protein
MKKWIGIKMLLKFSDMDTQQVVMRKVHRRHKPQHQNGNFEDIFNRNVFAPVEHWRDIEAHFMQMILMSATNPFFKWHF